MASRKREKNLVFAEKDRPLDGVFMTRHAMKRAVERKIRPEQILKQMKKQEKSTWQAQTCPTRVIHSNTNKAITVYNKNKQQRPLPPQKTPWCCPQCSAKMTLLNKPKHEQWHVKQLRAEYNRRFNVIERWYILSEGVYCISVECE